MYAGAIIGGITVMILGSLIKRMMELRATPLLLWPVLLVAGAAPALVTYDVLHPQVVTDGDGNDFSESIVGYEFDFETYGKELRASGAAGPMADRRQFPIQVVPTEPEALPEAPMPEGFADDASYETARLAHAEAVKVHTVEVVKYEERTQQYAAFQEAMVTFEALTDDQLGRQVMDEVHGGLKEADEAVLEPYMVAAEGKSLTFQLPDEGRFSVMVTAQLGEYDPDDPVGEKTSYALGISGKGWKQSVDDVIQRDTAGSGPDVALTEGEGISESGTRRGMFGEDLQNRYELQGNGRTTISIANWEPADGKGAAEALRFQIVRSPPTREVLWGLAGFMTLICFVLEVRYGCERVSNDVAFLLVWAVALRDGVTPLDDWDQIGKAMLPALLVGFLGVAGISYVLTKYMGSRTVPKKEVENGESSEQ